MAIELKNLPVKRLCTCGRRLYNGRIVCSVCSSDTLTCAHCKTKFQGQARRGLCPKCYYKKYLSPDVNLSVHKPVVDKRLQSFFDWFFVKDRRTAIRFARLSQEAQERAARGIARSIRRSMKVIGKVNLSAIREIVTDAEMNKFYFEELETERAEMHGLFDTTCQSSLMIQTRIIL